jgi:hypothetical protein
VHVAQIFEEEWKKGRLRKKVVDKCRKTCYNEKNIRLREKEMKFAYKSPRAMLELFELKDVLFASPESDEENSGDSFWSDDGTIHLPPVPLK